MFSAWLVGVLGIWTMIVPFLRLAEFGNSWNNWIVGLIAALLGFSLAGEHRWQRALAVIAGLWLLVSGFIPALVMGGAYMTNDMITGILLVIAGFASTRHHPVMIPPQSAH